jgi:EmrB/QacA subfamily drug resistance transporter
LFIYDTTLSRSEAESPVQSTNVSPPVSSDTDALTPAEKSVALNRPLLIAGMILATALSALDATIVATALPSIVGVLGGLPLYSLVISGFLLTATTTVPLYGKLSDIYGRKPVFMIGAGIFIVGSALCGLAWDMPSLILFRAVQGVGAGCVLPISLTIIGDLFDVEERAKLQGVFGAVWGVSSVAGPLVGGAIVQFADWRWVFFVNVPVGIISALLIFLYLREPHIHTRQRVDIAGAITLTFGVGLVLVGLQSGSRGGGWTAPLTLLTWAGAVLLLALFVFFERRAPAPILSLDLLSRPIIAVPCLAGLLSGGVLIGFSAYVPLLVQGSWGGTPIEAGLILAPLSIGWPLASSQTGKLVRRFPYRSLVISGTGLILLGTLLLLSVVLPLVGSNFVLRNGVILVGGFISGMGFGFSTSAMLIAVQISVPWSERGISTASVQFFRNMGNTIGASILGAVLTATLAPVLASDRLQQLVAQMPANALAEGADPALGPVNALFNLTVRDTLPLATRTALADALSGSLGWVYLGTALFAVTGALIASRFPREV